MTKLQQLKEMKASVFNEAKQMFPFVSVEMSISVYDANDKKLNDGGGDYLAKLTKKCVDEEIEYQLNHFSELAYIEVDFIPRGAETMAEFADGMTEIVDGAEDAFRIYDSIVRLAYRREVC